MNHIFHKNLLNFLVFSSQEDCTELSKAYNDSTTNWEADLQNTCPSGIVQHQGNYAMGELQDLGLLLWCIISQLQLPTIKTRLPDASCEGEGGAGQERGAVQCAVCSVLSS